MALIGTLRTLNALKAKLAALTWQQPGGGLEPAFERVELFDVSELEMALSELLVFKGRVCVVVLDGENFDNQSVSGPKLMVRQVRNVALLIADRDYGSRQRALTGSAKGPGVLALKDLVLSREVIGMLTETPAGGGFAVPLGIVVTPKSGGFVQLADAKRERLTGRLCWEQDLELRGGSLETSLGLAPVI